MPPQLHRSRRAALPGTPGCSLFCCMITLSRVPELITVSTPI